MNGKTTFGFAGLITALMVAHFGVTINMNNTIGKMEQQLSNIVETNKTQTVKIEKNENTLHEQDIRIVKNEGDISYFLKGGDGEE